MSIKIGKYILTIFCFCLLSCKVAHRRKYITEHTCKMLGQTIVIPDNLCTTYNGIDTVLIPSPQKTNKGQIIVYISTQECTLCKVSRLAAYKKMTDFISSQEECDFKFIIDLPSEMEIETYYGLEKNPIDFPVYLDKMHSFATINNHIDFSDPFFNTFLLDENNRIQLIGDPVNNPDLWNLYCRTIEQTRIKND